ncbi:unnamed protein product, partial [Heterosigma akashiwo]
AGPGGAGAGRPRGQQGPPGGGGRAAAARGHGPLPRRGGAAVRRAGAERGGAGHAGAHEDGRHARGGPGAPAGAHRPGHGRGVAAAGGVRAGQPERARRGQGPAGGAGGRGRRRRPGGPGGHRGEAGGGLLPGPALGDHGVPRGPGQGGGLEAVVQLAALEDVECQEYAALALAHLASNRDHQVRLVELGALRPLVSMMAVEAEPRHYAGLALLKLADNFENHLRIAEEGGIQALLRLGRARSTDEELQYKAALTVGHLASN